MSKWRVTPLPAFDAGGKFIKIDGLEESLRGSLVLVYFELKHYAIRDKKTDGIAGNTFSAIASQVKILERGADRRPSPYKSQMMKGPKFLPQSPSIKKDQVSAVNAFHPGKEFPLFLECEPLVIRPLFFSPRSWTIYYTAARDVNAIWYLLEKRWKKKGCRRGGRSDSYRG